MKEVILSLAGIAFAIVIYVIALSSNYVVDNTFISGMAANTMILLWAIVVMVRHFGRDSDYQKLQYIDKQQIDRGIKWLLLYVLCICLRISVPVVLWYYPDFVYDDTDINYWVPCLYVALASFSALRLVYLMVVEENWRWTRGYHVLTLLAIIVIIVQLCLMDSIWIENSDWRRAMVIIMGLDVIPGIARALILYI